MNTSPESAPPSSIPVLDPCLLGRPVHLLDGFARDFGADLGALLHARLNRRYGAAFEVATPAMLRPGSAAGPGGWLMYGSAAGRIAFALDRSVLLRVLAYRYGTAVAAADPETVRRTATEERLAAMLGRAFVAALAERIAALPGEADGGPRLPCESCSAPAGTHAQTWWMLRAEVAEAASGVRGAVWFALDEAWMNRLLRGLAPAHEPRSAAMRPREPLPRRLQLTLTARLLDKEFPLGTVMDLRVGDVIPIRLGGADVLVGESPLFRATVAEHRNKLCLTSFEDVE